MTLRLRSYMFIACLPCLTGCAEPAANVSQNGPAHWELSPEYVSATMMQSNASIDEALAYHQLVQLKSRDLGKDDYARYRRMAANMGLNPAPALYFDTIDTRPLPQAEARFTQQGRAYILINESARKAWSARELIAVLGHELVHIKEKHVMPENLADAYNHPELSIAHEFEADRVGAGPLGSCDPRALEAALQIVYEQDKASYLAQNPEKNADDYNALTGGDHPRLNERKAALEAMAANPPEGCR